MGSHHETSRSIANAFAAAYQQQFRKDVVVDSVEDPAAQVDMTLTIDGRRVHIEATEYLVNDELLEAERRNEGVRKHVVEVLQDSLAAVRTSEPTEEESVSTGCRVSVDWKTEPRKKVEKGNPPNKLALPRSDKDKAEFAAELAKLAVAAAPRPCKPVVEWAGKRISLLRSATSRGSQPVCVSGEWTIHPEDFPALARFVTGVTIRLAAGGVNAAFQSQVNGARWLDVDRAHIQLIVREKVAKLRDRYRENADGNPVYLLIYAEGSPTSRRVPFEFIPEITRLVRLSVCQCTDGTGEGDSFDQVWLMVDAFIDPKLYRVWPTKP